MTVFEKIKSKNIDEFARWYEENCLHDTDPCIKHWDRTYCKNCETIFENDLEYAYCEVHDKCRFFPELSSTPSNRQMIKIWLESEI